jgi:hypothetical protein
MHQQHTHLDVVGMSDESPSLPVRASTITVSCVFFSYIDPLSIALICALSNDAACTGSLRTQ